MNGLQRIEELALLVVGKGLGDVEGLVNGGRRAEADAVGEGCEELAHL